MIQVTKTFLPPQEEYQKILKHAWDKNWLTNRGDLVLKLEEKLKTFLNVPNLLITNNGTIALQLGIRALNLKGEIITTPFSYVATVSSIVWEHCSPVFVDIDPEYLTIDETKIEQAITENTKAILATHVYGNPCNVDAIAAIAKKHRLKVIYDAAHCFGVTYNGRSLFNYGDLSTCSFHATKIFHTGEGGAIFTQDAELMTDVFNYHNFGHDGPLKFHGLGINGKISELQAAMGIAMLPYMDEILYSRKEIVENYHENLKHENVSLLKIRPNTKWNYSYFPVIFNSEKDLIKVEKELISNNIKPRRYFYPSLNTLPYVSGKPMPISESIAKRVLCLPLYVGLRKREVDLILECIKKGL